MTGAAVDRRRVECASTDVVTFYSIYRRFFSARRNFTESETSCFVDVDFVSTSL